MNKQETIYYLVQIKDDGFFGAGCDEKAEAIDNAIIALDRDRDEGEWIDHDKDESWYRFQCSNCLALFHRGMFMKGYPYCPRCGAFMPGYDAKWEDKDD